MMLARSVILSALLIFSGEALSQRQYFEFHSDPQMNLHHLLYHLARSERLAHERLRGRVQVDPSDMDPPLTEDERATWNGALDVYAKHARADLLFDSGLANLKQAIAATKPAVTRWKTNRCYRCRPRPCPAIGVITGSVTTPEPVAERLVREVESLRASGRNPERLRF